ncbi:Fe-S cluster assembly protein SufD [Fluviicola sp. SGL-29]|nr:Fe-S cluster assembly protein SufD [Fluviicola sp. SGL-29]
MTEVIQESKIAKFREGLPKTRLPFRENILKTAENTLSTLDFPTTRNERWKYTRVAKIATKSFTAKEGIIGTLHLPVADAYTIVFVNGFYNQELSSSESPEGVTITALSSATEATELLGKNVRVDTAVFPALNTLHATDGAYVHLKAKTIVEKPIQIVHVLTGEHTIATTRNVIVSERFSEAEIVQVFLAGNATESFSNNVTEIFVEENATLSFDKLQNETEGNFHISTEHVKQAAHSNFKINTITLNGGLVRNDLFIDVEGENVETHLNGTYVLKGNQHVDNHTTVDHLKPNCESNELYKGVVDESATAVFNGKVFVRKDAQKINAYQSNGNVLLSDTASVNSKPELEIYADDVKCSHGSTTGQLDEDAIYYLRARGISEKSAKALMVTAFIGDVIDKIDNESVVEYVHAALHERFGWDF